MNLRQDETFIDFNFFSCLISGATIGNISLKRSRSYDHLSERAAPAKPTTQWQAKPDRTYCSLQGNHYPDFYQVRFDVASNDYKITIK